MVNMEGDNGVGGLWTSALLARVPRSPDDLVSRRLVHQTIGWRSTLVGASPEIWKSNRSGRRSSYTPPSRHRLANLGST